MESNSIDLEPRLRLSVTVGFKGHMFLIFLLVFDHLKVAFSLLLWKCYSFCWLVLVDCLVVLVLNLFNLFFRFENFFWYGTTSVMIQVFKFIC